MGEEYKRERDSKGDIKFDRGKIDWRQINESRYTYIFHYYDEKLKHHIPYFGLQSSVGKSIEKAKKNPSFYTKQLFWSPDHPPYDFFIDYHNWQLDMLIEYFKEVFEERAFLEGYMPSHKFFNVILPKSLHDKIINCINEFDLLPIRDLLFEVIAIAQQKYVEEIAFWERPENQKIINTAEKETRKAIEVIERLDEKKWMRKEPDAKRPSELLHINFAFNDGSVKIEHPWLAKEFIDHFKKYYDDLYYKNWRLDLERYPARFEDNIKKQQFKYNLAKSLYNLLTKNQFFKVKASQPYPNKLLLCLAKLMEFSLIPVGSSEETEEVKIKHIRNWLKRKELQPAITYMEVPCDRTRLLKYFGTEFINVADDVKRLDALALASYLGKRFNIDHLLPDLAHIAQVLNKINWMIGHQMFAGGNPYPAPFEEFGSFKKLIKGINDKRKITELKFKLDGDEKEYELKQRLPMYLIEEAIKEYVEDHQVEVDTDLVKTNLTFTDNGSIITSKQAQFNLPEERFMVRFVKAFYEYLLNEAPPENEMDFMPSKRYYTVIAIMLQRTTFFYHERDPEWFIIAKVKQWHNLSKN